MSNPEPNPQVDQLLQQGIAAARAGNRSEARRLLEQVVELDDYNEKGWFWLAAMVDTDEEKRVCLGNVIVINPNNKRARSLLDRLEAQQTEAISPVQPVVEVSERKGPPMVLIVGLAVIVMLALVGVLITTLGGDDEEEKTTPSPQSQVDAGNIPPTEPSLFGPPPVAKTPELPLSTPTPTQTPTARPATWTPVPSTTPIPDVPPTVYPPAPSNVTGQIIMRSGQVPGDPDNQPIVIIKPDGSGRREIASEGSRGHAPVLAPDGTHYVYVRYAPGTRESLLQINNFQGTDSLAASAYWSSNPILQNQDTPTWSPNGGQLAFAARGLGSATRDLFLLDLSNRNGDPQALTRLTDDDVVETWPAFSPEGQRIVYAADVSMVDFEVGNELRIYSLLNNSINTLTKNGPALVESAPDWSPDGQSIVFHAHAAGDPTGDTDIYLIRAAGSTEAEKIVDSDASDIQPRYSPDGQYIVFSSNRTGFWEVYIFQLSTKTLYQVTASREIDIANDWGS